MHTRYFTINKKTLDDNIIFFIKSLNEKIPDWAIERMCNGFAFLTFRADIIGELKRFNQRLLNISEAKQENIANALVEYRKTKKINVLTKQSQEWYQFINLLLATAHPSKINLMFNGRKIKQNDFLEMLNLFPTDKMLGNQIPVKKVFDFAYLFTPKELTYFLQNKFGEVFKNNDCVQVVNTEHTMYFSIKNKKYYFYNRTPVELKPNNAYQLSKNLQHIFFNQYNYDNKFMPIGFTIYRNKLQPANNATENTVLSKLLKNRHSNLIDIQGFDGATAVFLGAYQGCPELIEILAERKANLDKEDKHGWTPIMVAADQHNLECLDVLAKYKADFNKTSNGMSVVHYAAEENDCLALKKLIDCKASLTMRNNNNQTPALLALHYQNWQAAACCLLYTTEAPSKKKWLFNKKMERNILEKIVKGCLGYLHEFEKDPNNQIVMLQEVIHGKNALGKMLLKYQYRFKPSGLPFSIPEHPMRMIEKKLNQLIPQNKLPLESSYCLPR